MPITPDDLARRFPPPLGTGPLQARAAEVTDLAYQLAEQVMSALPRGHHADEAVRALESAAHWVTAGLAAVVADEAAEADATVPYVLGGPADLATGAVLGAGLDLNVSVWRTGVLRGALTPAARLVGVVLAESAGLSGFIADVDQPSLETLCLAACADSVTVLHALEELCSTAWISRHSDAGMTRYQLRLPVPTSAERPSS